MKPPSGGPSSGADQRRDGEIGQRLDELALRHRAQQDQAADRHHHGAAQALQRRAATTSHSSEVGEAAGSEARVNTAMAARNTLRAPKRSAPQPLIGMKTASAMR